MSEQVVHRHPPHDSWKLPCCKKFVFFMPNDDLLTRVDAEVTCKGES